MATAAPGLASTLGLSSVDLDEIKEQAASVIQGRSAKKPKLLHKHFFDESTGLRTMIRDFGKIKFKGKGYEFEDLSLLLKNYSNWFHEIYPYEDNLSEMVEKARRCLQEKEKSDTGSVASDPREQLHLLRADYKNTARPAAPEGEALSEEVRLRIEANRKRAQELKRKRDAARDEVVQEGGSSSSNADPAGPAPPAATFLDTMEEEDVFGFGGGIDDGDDFSAPAPVAQVPKVAAATLPEPTQSGPDNNGLSDEQARRIAESRAKAVELKKKKQAEAEAKAAADAAKAASSGLEPQDIAQDFFEEEDVFGFGGGLDEP